MKKDVINKWGWKNPHLFKVSLYATPLSKR